MKRGPWNGMAVVSIDPYRQARLKTEDQLVPKDALPLTITV